MMINAQQKTQVFRSSDRHNHMILTRCFYTGIDLALYRANGFRKEHYYLTREHLISKSKAGGANFSVNGNAKQNIVPAARSINEIVGAAPLSVKFALKKYLNELNVLRHDDIERVMNTYTKHARSFILRYKLHGIYPWDVDMYIFSKKKKNVLSEATREQILSDVRERYSELLTFEEKQLLRLAKKKEIARISQNLAKKRLALSLI